MGMNYTEKTWTEALDRHGEAVRFADFELVEDVEGNPLGVTREDVEFRFMCVDKSVMDAIQAGVTNTTAGEGMEK